MSLSKPHARIYQPAKNAMQSGRAKDAWILEYDRRVPSTPNPLMGWNSMPDTLAELRLRFASREEAVAYATAKNIDFQVVEPHGSVTSPKAYADNFSATKRRAWDASC